jgi:SAM-dependent methyltransferase
MSDEAKISEHWSKGDVYARILAALDAASKPLDALTIEDLAPVDHFHARGFTATIELANQLPIKPGHHILDIGCGLGGPARYLAQRFGCKVSGVDITAPFIEVADKLTKLLNMEGRVALSLGDGHHLPYDDATFDGAYTQHVTMNVEDRKKFFSEACRVMKPGAFFAITEHGLGPAGDPHYPLPWSEDGNGAYLKTPEDTRRCLEQSGFSDINIEYTRAKYLEGYQRTISLATRGELPPLGIHILMGDTAPQKTKNAARNIEERRTEPVQIICHKRA